jgi:hypothetical protein
VKNLEIDFAPAAGTRPAPQQDSGFGFRRPKHAAMRCTCQNFACSFASGPPWKAAFRNFDYFSPA